MDVVASGLGFLEGPVASVAGGIVVVSVDQGTVVRVTGSRTDVLARLGAGANGAAELADGTIVVAHSGRRLDGSVAGDGGGVDLVAPEGVVTRLRSPVDSPNDLCLGPDGRLYVTDPVRPLGSRRGRVWRLDLSSGEAELVLDVDWYPNGIAFDDADRLHVANTDDAIIVRVGPAGDLTTVASLPRGRPDGLAFDVAGNLLVATVHLDRRSPAEIQVFDPDGRMTDPIQLAHGCLCTNVCVDTGGTAYATIADHGCLVRLRWPVPGLRLHPFRSSG